MTDHRLDALHGNAPHAFLAAVGLLVHAGDHATLRFDDQHPVLDTDLTPDELATSLLDDCRLDEHHPLQGDWCRATASADGWAAVGAPRSWAAEEPFGPAWTRMVRPAVWKEPGTKHALSGLWLNTSSGKIGVCTQLQSLVPVDGRPGKVTREKVAADIAALLSGGRPTPDGTTVLGLGASRAQTCHTVELLTLVGGLLQPPGTRTPSGERGLTWCLWDVPLTLAQAYPVLRDPARMPWDLVAARIVSPDTGSYAKVFGPTTTERRGGRSRAVGREADE